MKKTLVIFMVVAILIWLFEVCRIRNITHLTKADLEWIDCYYLQESVLFKNIEGQIDTMYITGKTVHNSTFPFMNPFLKFETGPDYIANASIEFKLLHRGYKYEGYVYIRKNMSYGQAVVAWQFGNLISLTDLFSENGNIDFNSDAYSFTANLSNSKSLSNLLPPDTQMYLTSFEWSREIGLKCYTFNGGERYNPVYSK